MARFEVGDKVIVTEGDFKGERGAIVDVHDDRLGTVAMPGVVPQLARSPGSVRWGGPALGAHTDEVLGELLGLDAATLAGLRDDGVIG